MKKFKEIVGKDLQGYKIEKYFRLEIQGFMPSKTIPIGFYKSHKEAEKNGNRRNTITEVYILTKDGKTGFTVLGKKCKLD